MAIKSYVMDACRDYMAACVFTCPIYIINYLIPAQVILVQGYQTRA